MCFINFNRTVNKLNNTYTSCDFNALSVPTKSSVYALQSDFEQPPCCLPAYRPPLLLCVSVCAYAYLYIRPLCYFIGSIIRLAGRPLIAPGTDRIAYARCVSKIRINRFWSFLVHFLCTADAACNEQLNTQF